MAKYLLVQTDSLNKDKVTLSNVQYADIIKQSDYLVGIAIDVMLLLYDEPAHPDLRRQTIVAFTAAVWTGVVKDLYLATNFVINSTATTGYKILVNEGDEDNE